MYLFRSFVRSLFLRVHIGRSFFMYVCICVVCSLFLYVVIPFLRYLCCFRSLVSFPCIYVCLFRSFVLCVVLSFVMYVGMVSFFSFVPFVISSCPYCMSSVFMVSVIAFGLSLVVYVVSLVRSLCISLVRRVSLFRYLCLSLVVYLCRYFFLYVFVYLLCCAFVIYLCSISLVIYFFGLPVFMSGVFCYVIVFYVYFYIYIYIFVYDCLSLFLYFCRVFFISCFLIDSII